MECYFQLVIQEKYFHKWNSISHLHWIQQLSSVTLTMQFISIVNVVYFMKIIVMYLWWISLTLLCISWISLPLLYISWEICYNMMEIFSSIQVPSCQTLFSPSRGLSHYQQLINLPCLRTEGQNYGSERYQEKQCQPECFFHEETYL